MAGVGEAWYVRFNGRSVAVVASKEASDAALRLMLVNEALQVCDVLHTFKDEHGRPTYEMHGSSATYAQDY